MGLCPPAAGAGVAAQQAGASNPRATAVATVALVERHGGGRHRGRHQPLFGGLRNFATDVLKAADVLRSGLLSSAALPQSSHPPAPFPVAAVLYIFFSAQPNCPDDKRVYTRRACRAGTVVDALNYRKEKLAKQLSTDEFYGKLRTTPQATFSVGKQYENQT